MLLLLIGRFVSTTITVTTTTATTMTTNTMVTRLACSLSESRAPLPVRARTPTCAAQVNFLSPSLSLEPARLHAHASTSSLSRRAQLCHYDTNVRADDDSAALALVADAAETDTWSAAATALLAGDFVVVVVVGGDTVAVAAAATNDDERSRRLLSTAAAAPDELPGAGCIIITQKVMHELGQSRTCFRVRPLGVSAALPSSLLPSRSALPVSLVGRCGRRRRRCGFERECAQANLVQ